MRNPREKNIFLNATFLTLETALSRAIQPGHIRPNNAAIHRSDFLEEKKNGERGIRGAARICTGVRVVLYFREPLAAFFELASVTSRISHSALPLRFFGSSLLFYFFSPPPRSLSPSRRSRIFISHGRLRKKKEGELEPPRDVNTRQCPGKTARAVYTPLGGSNEAREKKKKDGPSAR